MFTNESLQRELPIDGRTIAISEGTWVIKVQEITVVAHNSIRTAMILLQGNPNHQVELRVSGESLLVEHTPGDIEWLMESLRLWLVDPNPKAEANRIDIGF